METLWEVQGPYRPYDPRGRAAVYCPALRVLFAAGTGFTGITAMRPGDGSVIADLGEPESSVYHVCLHGNLLLAHCTARRQGLTGQWQDVQVVVFELKDNGRH